MALSARGPATPRLSPMSAAGVAMFANSEQETSLGAATCLTNRGPSAAARERAELASQSSVNERELAAAEAQFFMSDLEKEEVHKARHSYPSRKTVGPQGYDPLTGEPEEHIPRRIMGFRLGFEKIFATTSIKLPVSAYTIFVELHCSDKNGDLVYSRCFNGLHTVFDLKKWIFEKLLLPMCAYELSYAEPGKAALTDQLRLLTTQDSLDTRTMATTRAVHQMYRGIPGVHSIGDIGVTRLYVRLKCRTCGDLLNSLQKCRRFKTFSDIEALPEPEFRPMRKAEGLKKSEETTPRAAVTKSEGVPGAGVPGVDPTIEERWYKPDEKKHCLFHTRGFEMYEAARTHGGHAELAKIFISCGKEPSRKLKVAESFGASVSQAAAKKISY